MSTPPGRLTRGTIIDRALSNIGNTKIKSLARTALNTILFDLNTSYEWPHLYATATVTLNQSTFTLPTNFLKSQDDNSLTITADGSISTKRVVLERDRQTFESVSYPTDATGTPLVWTVDRNADVGRIWPVPANNLTATLRYKELPADVDETSTTTYDADTPTFPWSRYLIQSIIVWALQYENDPRYTTEIAVADRMLSSIRQAAMPLHSQLSQVPLDPAVFTQPFRGEGTGWWE